MQKAFVWDLFRMNAFCIYEQLHEAFREARIAQVPVVLDIKVLKKDAPFTR
jgi:hypothetical protein